MASKVDELESRIDELEDELDNKMDKREIEILISAIESATGREIPYNT